MVAGATQRAWDHPRTEYYLAVTEPDDQLVGFVRLAFSGVRAAKLGYAIRADRWGEGYATDAAEHIIRPTASLLSRCRELGMQYEGRLRDHVFTNGAWRDSLLYAILRHRLVDKTEY